MTIHYHGTPITPIAALYALRGRHLCVSHHRPEQVERAHEIAQSVMLDNGAFSAWKIGAATDWPAYYAWCDRWLDHPTTWAVIPDVIDAGSQFQDALLAEWPHGKRGAPVWHMDEPVSRLTRPCEAWPLVCIGSTAEFAVVLSDSWRRRMDEAWTDLMTVFGRAPRLHMLRGMQCAREGWPFYSIDSTDVARNHTRGDRGPAERAAAWDQQQCRLWRPAPAQLDAFQEVA